MRLVTELIQGVEVKKALDILKFTQKEPAKRVEKLLLSAIANWQVKNEGVRIEERNLFVKEVFVGQGKTLKRLRPAPQGRAHRIRKRSNHVTIILDSLSTNEVETNN
jgi:large subunit ribosomal protein L22